MNTSNEGIIDYANSDKRNEFIDIYLGAKCTFCISTHAAFDEIPIIFLKPIAYVGATPIALVETHNKQSLIIVKKYFHKIKKKRLLISEIFKSNVEMGLTTDQYISNNIELVDNAPEEIKDLVIEMDEILTNKWIETDENLDLQKKIFSIFKKNIKDKNLTNKNISVLPFHGIIKSKFGAKYLRENQNLIN